MYSQEPVIICNPQTGTLMQEIVLLKRLKKAKLEKMMRFGVETLNN